eukprot:jgi/Tetstr1/437991/TSEL_026621.t1
MVFTKSVLSILKKKKFQIPSFLAHSLAVDLLLGCDLTPDELLMLKMHLKLLWRHVFCANLASLVSKRFARGANANRFTFGVVRSGNSSFQVRRKVSNDASFNSL